MRVSSLLCLITVLVFGCTSGWEMYSEIPRHYILAAKIWHVTYNTTSKDSVFKPVYGWKILETDTAIVVGSNVSVVPGNYKVQIKCKWQNPNPALRIIFELGNWNGFVKFQAHEEDESSFEQYLNLQEPSYKLKLGVTDGSTPEIENPSFLKTP